MSIDKLFFIYAGIMYIVCIVAWRFHVSGNPFTETGRTKRQHHKEIQKRKIALMKEGMKEYEAEREAEYQFYYGEPLRSVGIKS